MDATDIALIFFIVFMSIFLVVFTVIGGRMLFRDWQRIHKQDRD